MSQLRQDVEAVKQRIASSELAVRVNGWEIDGGSVTVRVKPDKQFLTCTIFYMSDSDYPNSSLMAMCADNDTINSALESFSDDFEYGAPVDAVLIRLLEEVGLDATPLASQQECDAASGDEDLDSEEIYSDTGQDMAETDNQVCLPHCRTEQHWYCIPCRLRCPAGANGSCAKKGQCLGQGRRHAASCRRRSCHSS